MNVSAASSVIASVTSITNLLGFFTTQLDINPSPNVILILTLKPNPKPLIPVKTGDTLSAHMKTGECPTVELSARQAVHFDHNCKGVDVLSSPGS